MLQRPGQKIFIPGESIAKRRLPCFKPNHSRNNRSIYLTTYTTHEFSFHFSFRNDHHVASGRTHYLAEVIGFDLSAHCSHMTVESSNTDDNICRQTQSVRPRSP